jgi:hypothetical protein
MILNHKAAIEFLVESAEEIAVDAITVQNLHALLTENLLANPMDGGQIRSAPVGIRGTVYLPTTVPQVVEECFRLLLRLARAIEDPFEQSFFLLVHLPYLQPFIDGNKRTARLAANIPFIRTNQKPITFADVPAQAFTDGVLAVYEQNQVMLLRDIFVFAYERSCARYSAVLASLGEPDPFRLRYRVDIRPLSGRSSWPAYPRRRRNRGSGPTPRPNCPERPGSGSLRWWKRNWPPFTMAISHAISSGLRPSRPGRTGFGKMSRRRSGR